MKFIGKSYSLYNKDIHQFWCRSAKFLWKWKFCSGSGSWFYFGFQYQTYISHIEDTHQILFRSSNSFESYCVHMKSPRTYSQTTRQTDRQTEIFLCLFCLLRHTKHEHSSKGKNFFFLTHAITILSLFTYSVCDEKVKSLEKMNTNENRFEIHLWLLQLYGIRNAWFTKHGTLQPRQSQLLVLSMIVACVIIAKTTRRLIDYTKKKKKKRKIRRVLSFGIHNANKESVE